MPTKRELRLYGDLINHYKPTFKTMIKTLFLEYFAKKMRYRHNINRDGQSVAEIIEKEKAAPDGYFKFAIVKDTVVSEIIVVNPTIANLLTSKKVKIVPFDNNTKVKKGMKYIDKKFVSDEIILGDNVEEN